MKKTALFAGILLCAMATQVGAIDKARADENCSEGDLRGVYSFVADGTLLGTPFATAGQTTYDGHGGAGGYIQFSWNGVVSSRHEWNGTYVVDSATCTATKTAVIPGLGPVNFFLTFGDRFNELRFISTTPGATISGSARKQ